MRLLIALLLPALALAQAVPESLTLEQALQIASENRAENLAADYSVEAQTGAVRQAGLAPNPTLSVQTENWRGGSDFSVSNSVDAFAFVSQQVELGGKRRLRTEAAEADKRIAEAEREVVRWRIEGEVRAAWWNAFRAQQETALVEDSLAAAQELVRYQEARWREGAAPEIDLIKVRVELQKERRRLADLEIEEVGARQRLLVEMGAAASSDFRLAPFATPASDLDVTPESAIGRRPDLLLLRAVAERDDALTNVERAETTPNITPYLGYKRTNGLNTLIGGVSIPLKLRDRNGGAIAQAVAQASRQKQLVRAMELRIRSEVETALSALRSRRELADSLETNLIPEASQAYEIALAAYRESGVELLYVIDAQRTLNEVKLLQLQAESDYQLSRAELLRVAALRGGVQ